MTDRPSAETFLTGWTVQNVNTENPTKAAGLVLTLIDDAELRGIPAEDLRAAAGGDLEAFMRREISAFAAAEPERELSRDD